MAGRRRRESEPVWRDPDEFLRWDFLPEVLAHVPIIAAMADTLRSPAFLSCCYGLPTDERAAQSPGTSPTRIRRDRRASELVEWRAQIMWFLAQAALFLASGRGPRRILTPIFAHDDETAASLIRPFVNGVAAAGIVDPPEINPNAREFMDACLTRYLRDRMWENSPPPTRGTSTVTTSRISSAPSCSWPSRMRPRPPASRTATGGMPRRCCRASTALSARSATFRMSWAVS